MSESMNFEWLPLNFEDAQIQKMSKNFFCLEYTFIVSQFTVFLWIGMTTVLDHLDWRKGREKEHGSTYTFNLYVSFMWVM